MKDLVMIWNRLAGRRYSTVNAHQPAGNEPGDDYARHLRRKSSAVVNQFFNATLNADGNARWPRSILILMIIGMLAIGTGCFIIICQPYDFLFKLKVVFSEGGEIFELWRKPPVDLYLKVYLFNVTNRDEYLSGQDSKLRFQQVGPYVYKEHMEHSNIVFNENGTVTATPIHPLKYVPEMSNGTEEDVLILPNIALLSITNVMKDASYFTRLGLNMLIIQTNTQPLVRMTSREFMFGYQSTLVTLGNNFMPSWIKFDKLGLIDRMYDFDGDVETVYTGEKDVRLTGLLENYNGAKSLPQWSGKCANINGASDGAKFPSYIAPNDTLLFFRKSLCRPAKMHRTSEKVVKGLNTYHYKFNDDQWDNGANNTENKCFCRQGRCLQPGLIDVTDCYYGFPIALSFPHFFKADPSVLSSVEGLNPQAELHESYFYIQPKSGVPVDLAFRFQINMALQDIGHMAHVRRFSNMILPLLWFEIGMYELPEVMNNRFLLYLNVLPTMQEVVTYGLFVLGSLFILWSFVKLLLLKPQAEPRTGQWYESEAQQKRLSFLHERRASISAKETESYYSSLLSPEGNDLPSEEVLSKTAIV